MIDFINFSITDLVDYLLVGLLVYQIFKLIRGTAAMYIFLGIIVFYCIYRLTDALHMNLLSWLLGQVMSVGALALLIVFQQEIRRFLLHLGTRYTQSTRMFRWTQAVFGKKSQGMSLACLDELTQACRKMSETQTGALIVLARRSSLSSIVETGDVMDAVVSRRLIENVFFKNAPLHDGAMLIVLERVKAARCTLPISDNPNVPAHYGMRHRAAMGVSEQTDALVVVVSEETGNISVVKNGQVQKMNSITELRLAIESGMKD
ncbi:MAG: diadenylate cyclase CdaA [Bacteroidales bacterium]|nr:diadenylate cyclase CdaA [Bacteroidales bacterium]MCL2738122.1 diadenylate cyclase CdaA [Bacteroidales bacterium]